MDWAAELTAQDIELVDKQFISEGFKKKEADMIYRIRCRDFSFFLVLEFQSSVDYAMSFRLLMYAGGVMKREFEAAPQSGRMGFKLPPAIPVVLYNGSRKWKADTRLSERLSGSPSIIRMAPELEYFLVDVGRLEKSFLLKNAGPLECVFLLDKSRDEESLKKGLRTVAEILPDLKPGERRAVLAWARDVLVKRMPNPIAAQLVFQEWEKGERETMITGIDRAFNYERRKAYRAGKKEGMEKIQWETVRRMYAAGFSLDQIQSATGVSRERILEITNGGETFVQEDPEGYEAKG